MKRPLLLGLFCGTVLTLVGPRAYGLAESTGPGGSNVRAVHDLGEIGEGVDVGVVTARHARVSHEAFKDANSVTHAFWYDATDQNNYEVDPTGHDTWVAGVVGSRGGATHPNDIGASPGVDIYNAKITRPVSVSDPNRVVAYSWFNNALSELIGERGCRALASGVAFPVTADTTPNGQSFLTLLHDYYAYQYDVVFAHPAANDPARVLVYGDAYNGITTGGLRLLDPNDESSYLRVGSLTGSGPTDDGRRKPDVVGPSQNQTMPNDDSDTSWYTWTSAGGETSLSGPHTASLAALLWGLADQTTETNDGHSVVIRAVIVNSTFPNIRDRNSNSTNPRDPNNVWHEQRGYGRIDGLRAYNLLASDRVFSGTSIGEQKGWAYARLSPGQEHSYPVNIPKKDYRLVATMTYDRRVEWTDTWPFEGKIDEGELNPYLADIDMEVFAPNDVNAVFNEELAGLDPKDNLEKCDLLCESAGQYNIRIKNNSANGEIASYGFAFELIAPLVADFNIDYVVDKNDLGILTQDWLQSGSEADVTGDGNVNLRDFAVFAANYGSSNPLYH
jgi:hypothetical protein